jgi:hypothetical protein
MTEEEKAAWNEGYKVGRQWAGKRLEGRKLSTLDVWALGAVACSVTAYGLTVAHSLGWL